MNILIAGDFAPTKQNKSNVDQSLFINFKIARRHDYAILNLEGPLTNRNQPIKKTGPNLSIDPRWAPVIREGGFNVVSLANNHILDMGEAGLLETLDHCDNEGLQCVGAGRNLQEAAKPLIIIKDGIKVGILAFAEKEFSIAAENAAGAAPIDSVDNYYAINALKEKVDHVVLILHAGNEYYPYPRPGLVKLCRYYIDLGASAIICHHAHVPVGYEEYKRAPIFYGTGNFYFPSKETRITEWYSGYLISLDFSNKGILSYRIIPYGFNDNTIEIKHGDECNRFLKDLEQKSRTISNDILLTKMWEAFCKEQSNSYIAYLLSNNKITRQLFRFNLLKPKLFSTQLLRLHNFFSCDSHRDIVITVIKKMIG